MQIKPAPRASYRKIHVDETDCPIAKERLRKLDKIARCRAQGAKLALVLCAIDLSKSTYYNWKKALERGGVKALVPKSRRPHRCARARWSARDEQRVLEERDRRPYCGKRRIHHALTRQGDFAHSVSTVGRILARARRRNRIRPCSFYQGRLHNKRPRDFANGHAHRWRHGEFAKAPGELVQIDHMTISFPGLTLKEFRAVCPFTRRMVSRVYSRATAFNARRFLDTLTRSMNVVSIQVDGGSEFRAEFEDACAQRNLPLSVLPPKRPQLNGRVERANSTSRTEFWSQYLSEPTAHNANQSLQQFLHYYNHERPHRSLNMMTPNEFFATLSNAA